MFLVCPECRQTLPSQAVLRWSLVICRGFIVNNGNWLARQELSGCILWLMWHWGIVPAVCFPFVHCRIFWKFLPMCSFLIDSPSDQHKWVNRSTVRCAVPDSFIPEGGSSLLQRLWFPGYYAFCVVLLLHDGLTIPRWSKLEICYYDARQYGFRNEMSYMTFQYGALCWVVSKNMSSSREASPSFQFIIYNELPYSLVDE